MERFCCGGGVRGGGRVVVDGVLPASGGPFRDLYSVPEADECRLSYGDEKCT